MMEKCLYVYWSISVFIYLFNLYLTRQVSYSYNTFLFTMTAYPGQTWTTLGQLCATLWDSQSRSDVMQTGFEPDTVLTPLALRCSVLDRCATRRSV